MKRGQISIFIIISIIIVIIIGIYFLFRLNTKNQTVSSNIKDVNDFVTGCILKTLEDGVFYISDTGGYFVISNLSNNDGTAYFYYKGQKLVPSDKFIEAELSSYINNFLEFCIKDFRDLKEYEINHRIVNSTVFIGDNKVSANVNYPLLIKKDKKSYQLKNFNGISLPIRLGIILNVSRTIANEMIYEKQTCISCISDIADKNELIINHVDYDKESSIYIITDPLSKVYNQNYTFYFAVKP